MHWAYGYAKSLIYAKDDENKFIVDTETVHLGNFRDIITSYFKVKALKNQGEDAQLLFFMG